MQLDFFVSCSLNLLQTGDGLQVQECVLMSEERDCHVVCGDRTFNVHSKVLVHQSLFFAHQLEHGITKVKLLDVDLEVVQFLYDGVVGNLSEQNMAEQMMLAEKLGIQRLKDELTEKLMLSLTKGNVVAVGDLAQRCNAKQLLEKSVQLIIDNSVKLTREEVVRYPALVLAIMEGYTSEASVVKEEIAVIKEQLRELSEDMGEATVY